MLELAKEVVEAEKGVDPVEERDRAKEALTELFNEAKTANTHIIVERIVSDTSGVTCNPAIEGHLVSGQRKPPKEASIGPLGLGAKLVAYFFPIALVFVGVTDSHRAPEQLPDLRA